MSDKILLQNIKSVIKQIFMAFLNPNRDLDVSMSTQFENTINIVWLFPNKTNGVMNYEEFFWLWLRKS